MPRGGYHPNAERWGRKPAWQSDSPTKTIRVPENLAEQVLGYAHKLDKEEVIDYDTKAKGEIEQLRRERDYFALELAECRASQPQQPDYEAIRDRVLAGLKLGRQAPGYKSAMKVLNDFISRLKA